MSAGRVFPMTAVQIGSVVVAESAAPVYEGCYFQYVLSNSPRVLGLVSMSPAISSDMTSLSFSKSTHPSSPEGTLITEYPAMDCAGSWCREPNRGTIILFRFSLLCFCDMLHEQKAGEFSVGSRCRLECHSIHAGHFA